MKRTAARVCVVAGLVALGLALSPGNPAFASDAQDGKREYWVERHQKLTADYARIRTQLDVARARYSRGRRDNRLRGDAKVEALKDIAQAEKDLGRTESAVASFSDDARKAGALPGWFAKLPPLPTLAEPAARSRSGASKRKDRRDREDGFRRRP